MTNVITCPKCSVQNVYFDGAFYVCPDCFYEWSGAETESVITPKDSNGTGLQDGDIVTVIKDLKVKGSSLVIKRGTKVRNIRLTDNAEEVD